MASDVPKDRGWAWMIGLGGFVQNVLTIGLLKSFGILFVEFLEEFKTTSAIISSIISVQSLSFAFAAPLVLHVLTSLFTNRQVMLCGAIIGSFGVGLGFFVNNIGFLIFTYGSLIGIGNACMYGPSLVMIGLYFEKHRGLVTAVAVAGGSIGQFAMPPVMRTFLDSYGLRGGLLLLGGLTLNCAATSSLMRPLDYYTRKKEQDKESHVCCFGYCNRDDNEFNTEQCEPLSDNGERSNVGSLAKIKSTGVKRIEMKNILDLSLLKNIKYIMLLFSACFGVVGAIYITIYIPAHAKDLGFSEQQIVWLVTIVGASDLVGRIACGVLADSGKIQRYQILVISFFLNGLLANLMSLFTLYWHLCLYCTIYGLIGSFYFSLISLVLADFFGLEMLPKSLGVLFFFEALTNAIAPLILGGLRDISGNYLASFYYMGSTSILASSILFCTRFIGRTTSIEKETDLPINIS